MAGAGKGVVTTLDFGKMPALRPPRTSRALTVEPWSGEGESPVSSPLQVGSGCPNEPLPRVWYARDAIVVARALLGCLLVHEVAPERRFVARIVETEAYRGPRDLACHARAGLTRRTRTLLGEEGHAYIYFIYGMHECFNVTCGGVGRGHAVLIRAAEPAEGFSHADNAPRLDGPGRLSRAMEITRSADGQDLTRSPLYICPRDRRPRMGITARVGVAYSGEWADKPWRFFDASSRSVSRPPKRAIGRGALNGVNG
jgi:DNA-3-methyladenine glycosylase